MRSVGRKWEWCSLGLAPWLCACPATVDVVAQSTSELDPQVGACATLAELDASLAAQLDSVFDTNAAYPLCVCRDGVLSQELVVTAPGGVSFGGQVDFGQPLSIAGDLIVASGLTGGSSVEVGGDLLVGGNVRAGEATFSIGGNAEVGGTLLAGSFDVGGELVMNPGQQPEVASDPTLTAVSQTLDAPETCACEAPTAVVTEVAAGVVEEVELSADEMPLHCGGEARWTPPSVASALRITGAGLLVVDQRLTVEGDLELAVEPGEQLDMIFLGGLHVAGTLSSVEGGGRARIYIADTGTLSIQGGGEDGLSFVGQIAGPSTEMQVLTPWDVQGALWVNRIQADEDLQVAAE